MPDPNQQAPDPKPAAAATSEAPATPAAATVPAPADPNLLVFPKSSNLTSAKFDPETGHVAVTFVNGATHSYKHFTAAIMDEWAKAKSAGNWFHANVRQHPERHPQVGAPDAPVPAQVETPKAPAKAATVVAATPPPSVPPTPAKSPTKASKKGAFWRVKGSRGYGNGSTTPA